MPAHPDTDQWIAELKDPKVHWADKVNKKIVQRVASSGDLRAVRPLSSFLYGLAWNGYRKPPPEFLQMMRDFVKSGEAKPAAETVLAVLLDFRDAKPGDPEEIGNMNDYRTWLVEALIQLGDAAVEPLMHELPNFHSNTTGYIAYALAKLGHGFEEILHIFETTQDEVILSRIAGVLGDWQDKRAIQPLKAYFERICEIARNLPYDRTDFMSGRRGSLQSLVSLGEIDYVQDAMRRYPYPASMGIRHDVLSILGGYLEIHPQDQKVRQTIENALTDGNPGIAHYAAIILKDRKRK